MIHHPDLIGFTSNEPAPKPPNGLDWITYLRMVRWMAYHIEAENPPLQFIGSPMDKPTNDRPTCYKHADTFMTYADGKEPHHDLRHPHWRCELWVGSGVCGATRPFTNQETEDDVRTLPLE